MLPSKTRDAELYGPEVDLGPPQCQHRNPRLLKVYMPKECATDRTEVPGRKCSVWREFECRKCRKRGRQYFGSIFIDWEGEMLKRHEKGDSHRDDKQ